MFLKNSKKTQIMVSPKKSITKIFFFLSCLLFLSCSNDINNNKLRLKNSSTLKQNTFLFNGDTLTVPNGSNIWEEQLKLAMKNTYIKDNGLEILGYEYVSDIDDYDQLKTLIPKFFSDSDFEISYFAGFESFDLIPMKEYDAAYKEYLIAKLESKITTDKNAVTFIDENKLDPNRINSIYLFNRENWGIVSITCLYKGNHFTTLCLVSKDIGVVYNHLFSNLVYDIPTPKEKI